MVAFFAVKMSLRTIRQALTFFTQAAEELYPTLLLLGIGVQVDRNLLVALDKVVDDEGAVHDHLALVFCRLTRRANPDVCV